MSDQNLDLTTTSCGECGKTSTRNEAMVACDGCDRWFHLRCIGLTTTPKKDKKWFCKEITCQAVFEEYQKQKKASRTKKIAEEFDKLSSKSPENRPPPSLPPTVGKKLKTMEAEKKRLEEEMDAECLLREKEIEMKNALKERRMRMERELRERELDAARQLREKEMEEKRIDLETELREKEEHLHRMKKMETSYREKMSKLEKQLEKLEVDGKPKKAKDDLAPGGPSKAPKRHQSIGPLTKKEFEASHV